MNMMWENIFRSKSGLSETRQILSQNIIFNGLNNKELNFVESLVHTRSYRAGEHVFRQGEVGVGMYMIVSGSVDISVDHYDNASNASSIYVTQLEPGDFFGEIALIEETGRRTANAITHSDTKLLGFFRPDLTELIDRSPMTGIKVVTNLAQVLGRRLRETSGKITELKKEIKKS